VEERASERASEGARRAGEREGCVDGKEEGRLAVREQEAHLSIRKSERGRERERERERKGRREGGTEDGGQFGTSRGREIEGRIGRDVQVRQYTKGSSEITIFHSFARSNYFVQLKYRFSPPSSRLPRARLSQRRPLSATLPHLPSPTSPRRHPSPPSSNLPFNPPMSPSIR